MKFVTIKEFKDKAASLMKGEEPVFVTQKGKPAGIFLPFPEESMPVEVKKELLTAFEKLVSESVKSKAKR